MDENSNEGASGQACTAQRIRVGLTGLAAVFLMVMVAAAGMRPTRSVAPVDSHGETLAVLGVAPSSGAEATLHKSVTPADVRPTMVRR
ncbi:MAG: hypothetical protein ACRYG4_10880 [Janthinobacterium lividum]